MWHLEKCLLCANAHIAEYKPKFQRNRLKRIKISSAIGLQEVIKALNVAQGSILVRYDKIVTSFLSEGSLELSNGPNHEQREMILRLCLNY